MFLKLDHLLGSHSFGVSVDGDVNRRRTNTQLTDCRDGSEPLLVLSSRRSSCETANWAPKSRFRPEAMRPPSAGCGYVRLVLHFWRATGGLEVRRAQFARRPASPNGCAFVRADWDSPANMAGSRKLHSSAQSHPKTSSPEMQLLERDHYHSKKSCNYKQHILLCLFGEQKESEQCLSAIRNNIRMQQLEFNFLQSKLQQHG